MWLHNYDIPMEFCIKLGNTSSAHFETTKEFFYAVRDADENVFLDKFLKIVPGEKENLRNVRQLFFKIDIENMHNSEVKQGQFSSRRYEQIYGETTFNIEEYHKKHSEEFQKILSKDNYDLDGDSDDDDDK